MYMDNTELIEHVELCDVAIYLIKKNICIKVLKEALGVKDDAEGAEFDDLEEANIVKMDNLFETKSETSEKEAENYKCAICQKMYNDNTELIEHVELCDVEENKESEEDRENVSCPYCPKLFSNSQEVLKH